MNARLRAYFELVRLPNLFTAAADVIGGFACNGGGASHWPRCAALAVGSMCLYAGGVALNDVCDADRDRLERPSRPIPSGRIPRPWATVVAVGLLLIGFSVIGSQGRVLAAVAGALAVTIVLYDAALKSTSVSPVAMGLCRSLNLAIGMLGASTSLASHAVAPIFMMGLYVASITVFAREEAGQSSLRRLALGLIGVCAAVLGLIPVAMMSPQRDPSGVVLVMALLVFVGSPARRALRRRTPQAVQQAVKRFVIGVIVFDAVVAWLGAGWPGAILVGSLLIPAILLGRAFRVT